MNKKKSDDHRWSSLGKQGKRIIEVLRGVDPNDEMACYEKWMNFLNENLTFPIEATYSDSDALYGEDEKVSIKVLSDFFDLYGIIATVRMGRKKLEIPLCEIEVNDKRSKNHKLINDYNVWFANN